MKVKKLTMDTLKKIIKEERAVIKKGLKAKKLSETKRNLKKLIVLLKEEKNLKKKLRIIKSKTSQIKEKIKES